MQPEVEIEEAGDTIHDRPRPNHVGEKMPSLTHPGDSHEKSETGSENQKKPGPIAAVAAQEKEPSHEKVPHGGMSAGKGFSSAGPVHGEDGFKGLLPAEPLHFPGPGSSPVFLENQVRDHPRTDCAEQHNKEEALPPPLPLVPEQARERNRPGRYCRSARREAFRTGRGTTRGTGSRDPSCFPRPRKSPFERHSQSRRYGISR